VHCKDASILALCALPKLHSKLCCYQASQQHNSVGNTKLFSNFQANCTWLFASKQAQHTKVVKY